MTQTNDPPLISSLELIPDAAEKADLDAPNTSGGKLVIGQAPNITITETTVVADAAERLALDVQEGDIAIQTNVSSSFIFTGGDNVANNWETVDFDAVGAIDGEDITPSNITASGDISLQNLTVAGAFNGADTSAAAAGEALTSDGSGSFTFASVGGGQIVRNGLPIDYVTLDASNLPPATASNEVALLTASNEYVQDTITGFFNISSATLGTSINTENGRPRDITWGDDGFKLYECGNTSPLIHQSIASTPFDITTVTSDTSISTQDSLPTDLEWNDDGSKLYEMGRDSGGDIYEYIVSTPFDISSASFSTSIATQDSTPTGIAWNDDGTKLYEAGLNSTKIYESTLSTAYDITTASFDTSINTQDSSPQSLAWNDDGTRLYELGNNQSKIFQYTVSTPYDIDTAVLDTSISARPDFSTGIAWDDIGTQLYECTSRPDNSIYQYNINATDGWESL